MKGKVENQWPVMFDSERMDRSDEFWSRDLAATDITFEEADNSEIKEEVEKEFNRWEQATNFFFKRRLLPAALTRSCTWNSSLAESTNADN